MALCQGAAMFFVLTYFVAALQVARCNCNDARYSGGNYHLHEGSGSLELCIDSLVKEMRSGFLYSNPISSVTYHEDIDFPNNHNFTSDPYFNFTVLPEEEFCFEITIIDDNITELQYEYYYFTFGVYTPEPIECRTGRIRIEDNDYIYYSGSRDLQETIGLTTSCIVSRAKVKHSAFLNVYSFSVTYGEDIQFLNYNFTENPFFNFTLQPEGRFCFNITVIDDSIAENKYEYLNFHLGVYSPKPLRVRSRRISVQDNEGVRFEHNNYYAREDSNTTQVCTTYRGDNVLKSTEVTISLNQNTQYVRYSHGEGDVLFSPKNVTLTLEDKECFDVQIVNDNISERTEDFFIDVILSNGTYNPFYRDTTRVRIYDNEGDETLLRIGFEMSAYTVVESEKETTVCLYTEGGIGTEVFSVHIQPLDITTQGTTDYMITSQWVKLSAANTTKCIAIPIIDDADEEENEHFLLSLRTDYYAYRPISGNFPRHRYFTPRVTISIIDDDIACDPSCVNGVCASSGFCQCDEGWSGEDCSQVGLVNECEVNNGGCIQGVCIDLPFGYNCSCDKGFTLSKEDKHICYDVDECLEENNECDQSCVNTDGSYYCTCERGFERYNSSKCRDINECDILPNGLCNHVCINTMGSYHCECWKGYEAVGRYLCQDIDECKQETDNCTNATCVNGIGDYSCSCDDHFGCRLAPDNRSCEDIDECMEEIHVCSDICINIIGSYTCECSLGFALNGDKRTCEDIDECYMYEDVCSHTCTNTYGSYFCTCNQSYELIQDNRTCKALSCPLLEAPVNGSMLCDTQTVGGTCSFSCESTYTLRGSTSRSCLPSLEWTGRPTLCDPPMCPELTPPDNGFVLLPCTRERSHTCSVVCAHGYNITGPPQQMCELDPLNKSLIWTKPATCNESDRCKPNTCKHNGVCSEEINDFICDCSGIKYTGLTCEKTIIHLPPVPTLMINRPYNITVTRHDVGDTMKFYLFDDGEIKAKFLFQDNETNATHTLNFSKPGIHNITVRHTPKNLFEVRPSEFTLFVTEESEQEDPYFKVMGLDIGQLKEGCCTSENARLSCPQSTQQVILKAVCQWKNDWVPGIVFADGPNISLPVSVAGYNETEGSMLFEASECTPCKSDQSVCMQKTAIDDECYCYNFTGHDIQDFLNTQALGITYIEHIQNLLPTWLKLQVNQVNLTAVSTYFVHHYLAPIVQSHLDFKSIEGCNMITPMTPGRYSVLRYDNALTGEIDGHSYTYNGERENRDSNDTLCFAVNLCQGANSPVFLQLSQPVQNMLVYEHLQRFVEKGWQIKLNTVTLSRSLQKQTSYDGYIWNGIEMVKPQPKLFDISVNTNTEVMFQSENLSIYMTFDGDFTFQYQVRMGYFTGNTTLTIQSVIDGDERNLFLSSQRESHFSIQDGNPCKRGKDDLYGIFISTTYRALAVDVFFIQLLTLDEVTQECFFDVFLPIGGDYSAHGLSMHTECSDISLGNLVFQRMSHVINIIGSSPECFQNDSLGIPDPALVIHSKLKDRRSRLGNFLELTTTENGDDMTIVFGKRKSGFTAILHSVKVSIFSNSFTASARIEDNVLNVSGITMLFQYPAYVHISSHVYKNDWKKLSFTLDGNILPGENSLITKVNFSVVNQLLDAAQRGTSRKKDAEMLQDEAIQRLNKAKAQYNESLAAIHEANESYNIALIKVDVAKTRLMDAQVAFSNSSTHLPPLEAERIKNCSERICENECTRGNICTSCFEPTIIAKRGRCPTTVRETKALRVPPYFEQVRTWEWSNICRTESNQECVEATCPIGMKETCHSKFVPITSRKPVYHWTTIEVDVVTYKSCTVHFFNTSVPSTCCESSNCAVRVPNISCVRGNSQCRQLTVSEDVRTVLLDMQEAHKNVSLAQIAATAALLELQMSEQSHRQASSRLKRFKAASVVAETTYRQTLLQVTPSLMLADIIEKNSIEKVFSITGINIHSEFMMRSPENIPLNIFYETPYNNQKYERSFNYQEFLGTENIQQIAHHIVDNILDVVARRSEGLRERVPRQQTEESSRRDIFDARCAHVQDTQLFFSDIHKILKRVQQSIDIAHENTELLLHHSLPEVDPSETVNLTSSPSDLNIPNTNMKPVEDEEVTAYLELLRTYVNLSAEGLVNWEQNIFDEWQASMEHLYSEFGSVGVYDCHGFADCLQISMDHLYDLISLTPKTELSEAVLMQLEFLPAAERQFLDLGTAGNITIQEALENAALIVNIMKSYATDNYWCNSPPIITLQPPAEVNVSLGGTLQLACEANSTLSVTYEWKKDGNTLPEFTNNELVFFNLQRLDSGNYTCIANNPVGSAESITTSVAVYELPSFYLLPQSVATYFGDDNGAWFACIATAWPYPGWRWYYRASEEMKWTLIEGEETNELLIPEPQKQQEGWYMCEAYNYHGVIQSEPVSLLLLPFSVSQQQYPLEFSIIKDSENSFCNSDKLHSAVSQKILEVKGSEMTVLMDLSITQVDAVTYDISLSLLSENVTTRYLHLMTFAEIANLALPKAVDLRNNVESITQAFERDDVTLSCQGVEFTVVAESVIVDKLTYVCPSGQELNTDYLLCVSCEPGKISEETDRSRIVNGKGFSERVPVCQPCPLGTYTEDIGSSTCRQCPKYHTTLSTATSSINDCIPQTLLLECKADGSGDHVAVDCQTNRPPVDVFCSFDGGPKHICSYPLAINLGVSPPGSHSLRIIVEDDEGFTAEDTVSYLIDTDSVPTVPAQVPPLTVYFVNDSPRVINSSVEADIVLSRPVQSLVCHLKSTSSSASADCSDGHVHFYDLERGTYVLRVVATNQVPDKELIRRAFEISNDPEHCSTHLINNGVTVEDNNATIEFAGSGPATGYKCKLDRNPFYLCSSPVTLSGLAVGNHQLRVVPAGCGRNRKILKTSFTVLEF